MEKRIVITGIGVLAANGSGKDAFFENSKHGISGLKKATLFDSTKFRTEFVGEIDNPDFPYLTNTPQEKERIIYIMEQAIEEAYEDANLTPEIVSSYKEKSYLTFATSLAANGRIIGHVKDTRNGILQSEWLTQIPSFVPWIKDKCGILGGCYVTMAACAAGTTSAGMAYDLIKSGKADLVICGGADPLTEFSCLGFNVLKSLSSSLCKPFDNDRDGINIGEGGAFFVIETLESAIQRNAKIYAEIFGYGINNDAYHITSPSPFGEGAIASMGMALSNTLITPTDITYINSHGTGTKLNDAMEIYAIENFFGETDVYVSTNKSMIGHCLAAAGAIELASTLLTIDQDYIIPNVRLKDEMGRADSINLPTDGINKKIDFALSNSYAFAGNTASILLGKFYE